MPAYTAPPRRTLRLSLILALLLSSSLAAFSPHPVVAAACTVTSTADTATGGTLREKLGDSTCGAIAFSLPGSEPWAMLLTTDLPTLTRVVRVIGPGATKLTINRNNTTTGVAFGIATGGDLTLSDLTVTGASRGVALAEGSKATVMNSYLSANGIFLDYYFLGGGVYADYGGSVTVVNSTLSGNAGAGVYLEHGGSATVMNSTLNGNTGAGIHAQDGGSAVVTASLLSGNGVGVQSTASSRVAVTKSTFSGNGTGVRATYGSDAIVTDSTLRGNGTGVSLLKSARATVTNSTISGNINGLYAFASGATVTGSTISGNADTGVSAIYGGSVTVKNSIVSDNDIGVDADAGGGATLENSTLSDNATAGMTVGDGITNSLLTNSTLSRNGTGLQLHGGGVMLANSLLAQGGNANCSADPGVALPNADHSLADDQTCFGDGTNGSHVVAAGATGLDLAGPRDNGGPTKTIALLPASPAIDAGNDTTCKGDDQRGVPRPQGVHCDIGAFERPLANPSAPTLTVQVSGASGGLVTPPPGSWSYLAGTVATLGATAPDDGLFVRWMVDGQVAGWANPLTLKMETSHTVVAIFAPAPVFDDVAVNDRAADAIANLAARGIINGCDAAAFPPLFCPSESTLREQMAALIARAMPGWADETGLPTFTDNTADTELMTRVATLQRHGVVRGYQDVVCIERHTMPPCYGPLDQVTYGQALLFIARAMVAKGYWTLHADDRAIFPDQNGAVGADPHTDQQTLDHRMIVTYTFAAGAPPDVNALPGRIFLVSGVTDGGWAGASSRGWFARAFWQALNSYFGFQRLP